MAWATLYSDRVLRHAGGVAGAEPGQGHQARADDDEVDLPAAAAPAARPDQPHHRLERDHAPPGPARTGAAHRRGERPVHQQGSAAARRWRRTRHHPQRAGGGPGHARGDRPGGRQGVRERRHLFPHPRHHRRGDGPDGGDAEPRRPQQTRSRHRRGVRGDDLWRGAGQLVHAAHGGAPEGPGGQAVADARDPDRRTGVDRARGQPAPDRVAPAGLRRMRRHKHEEHLNHEAWAIPYADLMTLLLAFFVVMYAVSVVNEGKFRVMSESLIQAFNGTGSAIAPPATTKGSVNASAVVSVDRSGAAVSPIALPIPQRPPPVAGAGTRAGAGQQDLDNIEDQVRRALQPLIDRKLVVVRHKQSWLEVEIRTDILFPSGVAQLSTSANAVLQSLATILARFPNPLRVEGFTDNVPTSPAPILSGPPVPRRGRHLSWPRAWWRSSRWRSRRSPKPCAARSA